MEIINSSEISHTLHKETGQITFEHTFELENGEKIKTSLNYLAKDITDIESFKKTLLPTIKKTVQAALSYGLGDKADKVHMEKKQFSRFKDNVIVPFKKNTKNPDFKVVDNLDQFLKTKLDKLSKAAKPDKKQRLERINVLNGEAPSKKKKNEVSPEKKEKSSSDSKPPAKKKVTFSDNVEWREFSTRTGLMADNDFKRYFKETAGKDVRAIDWNEFKKIEAKFIAFKAERDGLHPNNPANKSGDDPEVVLEKSAEKRSKDYEWDTYKKEMLELLLKINNKKPKSKI